MIRYHEILVVYASAADRHAIDHAVGLAEAHNARLTIAVPVLKVSGLVYLSGINPTDLGGALADWAERVGFEAIAGVPADVSATTRCVPRTGEAAMERELAQGRYDLYVMCDGRRDPGEAWARLGRRLNRAARQHGVASLLVPRCPVLAAVPAWAETAVAGAH